MPASEGDGDAVIPCHCDAGPHVFTGPGWGGRVRAGRGGACGRHHVDFVTKHPRVTYKNTPWTVYFVA